MLDSYTVTSNADPHDLVYPERLTLREAINAANASINEASEIYFAVSSIELDSSEGPLQVADPAGITIGGPPGSHVTVVASAGSRAFSVTCNASFIDLTITGCIVETFPVEVFSGGGIDNLGGLTLTGVTIQNCTSTTSTPNGGGIYNRGSLILNSTTIDSCSAEGSGGGIYNHKLYPNDVATVTVNSSADVTISNNTADGDGGGIYNDAGATLTVNGLADVSISNNSAGNYVVGGNGGGIYNPGGALAVAADADVFSLSGNKAIMGSGGGLYNSGTTLAITGWTVENNESSASEGAVSEPCVPVGGGGICSYGANLTISGSTFSGNKATGTSSDIAHPVGGGGICNYMGNLSVTNSEISDNEASGTGGQGGGVYHDGGDSICAMSIEDSAITNNDATAKGGGIYHDRGNLTISGTSTTLMVEEEETSVPYWIADEKECQWTADNVADFLDHYDAPNDAIDPADGVTILSGNRAGGNGGGNGSDPMLQRRQDVRVPGNERGEGLAAEGTGPSAKGGRYGPGTP